MVPGVGVDGEDFGGFGPGHGGRGGGVDEAFHRGAFLGCGQGVDCASDGGGDDFMGVPNVKGDNGSDVGYSGDV